MEEKKNVKMNLLIVFLIIAIIIILVMGYFLYRSNLKNTNRISVENDLNAKIAELENEVINKNEEKENNNDIETSKMSFSEIMNIIYTKNGTKIGENNYDNNPSDSVDMIYEDESGNITNIEYTKVGIYDGEISFNMKKVEPDKEISTSIEGITEEVVSIKILQVEGGATPSVVYFLTRNGNVYYIDEEMINSNNFVAKQLTDLKEIISIEIVGTLYPDAMEGSTTLIATTYNGKKIDVLK